MVCPNGHDSATDDYCSVCGSKLAGAAPGSTAPPPTAAAPPAGDPCPNCAEPHGPNDVFCENCGYDFLAGSLPPAEIADPAFAGPTAAAAAAAGAAPVTPPPGPTAQGVELRLVVSVDREYFDRMQAEGTLDFADPVPEPVDVALASAKTLIGRRSESRGVYPELDIAELTGDPAVSSRHASLEQQADGSWKLTDLNSTNGTYLDGGEDELKPAIGVDVAAGSVLHVGAWTRIEILEA